MIRQPTHRTVTRSMDLNADLGEHDGDRYAEDFALLDVVSSASIACGAHAGSPDVMRRTVAAAAARGVSIGAHPGYPDREGFGRRETGLSLDRIASSVIAQIELMVACCKEEGARLRYVKPHGALYNRAAREPELARVVAKSVAGIDESIVVLALAGSTLEREARSRGVKVATEAFIDRAYQEDGALVPRDRDGAVLHDAEAAAARAVRIAKHEPIKTIEGRDLSIDADSLCVHGDSRNALEIVSRARTALEESGIAIRSFAP